MAVPRRVRVDGERNHHIYRRPDGVLEVGYRDSLGKQRWHTVTGGMEAARTDRDRLLGQRASGERVAADRRLTFNTAADEWLAARVARLEQSTQETYGAHLAHLRRKFGRARLTAIESSTVAKYIAELERAGVKGWTIRGRLTVLSGVFSYATRHLGHPGANPVRALDRVERPSVADEAPKRILTDDELARLLGAVSAPDAPILELIAETGMRKSEAAGLVVADLDLDGMTIRVEKQLERRGARRKRTKTKNSVRTIVITPARAARLREQLVASGARGAYDLVFRRPSGEPYNRSSVDRAVRMARERAGLGPVMDGATMIARAPTPHDLRHSHVSRLIAAGWDVAEIAARVGDSIETVMTEYAHEWDARRRQSDQRDRLAALYGSAMEAPGSRIAQQAGSAPAAEVTDLQARRARRQ